MGRNKTTRVLEVYLNKNLVGTYTKSQKGSIAFQYAASWLSHPSPISLSYSLPLTEAPYTGEKVSAFFENLLPEGPETRRKIAQNLGAEGTEAFDLLRVMGRDCVGALQFLEEGSPPPKSRKVEAEPVTDKKIEESLKNLPSQPLGLRKDRDFRISITGVQGKLAYLRNDGKWMIPLGSTPTSHILKPPMGIVGNGIDLSTSVENEWLCLKIAEYLGLETARAEIHRFGDRKVLAVERFDRKWSPDKRFLERIHQEDLCQAFGIPSVKKYESDGGPGIPKIMRFLNASDDRVEDRHSFFKAQLIYFILGAIDGHAKNFSLFVTPTGFKLTPVYDIISVYPALADRQIEIKEARQAMSVGDGRKYKLRDIYGRHWEQTARKSGLSEKDLKRITDELREKIAAGLRNHVALPKGFPEKILEQIIEGTEKAAQRLPHGL